MMGVSVRRTIQPAPLLYANFCASAHLKRNSSVALNCVGRPHSPNQSGVFPRAASDSTRSRSERGRKLGDPMGG